MLSRFLIFSGLFMSVISANAGGLVCKTVNVSGSSYPLYVSYRPGPGGLLESISLDDCVSSSTSTCKPKEFTSRISQHHIDQTKWPLGTYIARSGSQSIAVTLFAKDSSGEYLEYFGNVVAFLDDNGQQYEMVYDISCETAD